MKIDWRLVGPVLTISVLMALLAVSPLLFPAIRAAVASLVP